MVQRSRETKAEMTEIVDRAVTKINDRSTVLLEGQGEQNATALLLYLVQNGMRDEEELVELALLAKGKRYNPGDGTFS